MPGLASPSGSFAAAAGVSHSPAAGLPTTSAAEWAAPLAASACWPHVSPTSEGLAAAGHRIQRALSAGALGVPASSPTQPWVRGSAPHVMWQPLLSMLLASSLDRALTEHLSVEPLREH